MRQSLQVRLAHERDKVMLTNEFVRFISRDRDEADRNTIISLQLDRTWVIQDQSLLLGLLRWGRREATVEGIAQIMDMRVLPTKRGTGLGGKLLEAAMADMKKYYEERGTELRRVYVIGPENDYGKFLFEKHGFVHSGTMPNHYADGRTALLYVWGAQ